MHGLQFNAGPAGATSLRGATALDLSGVLPLGAAKDYFGTYDRHAENLVNDHAYYVQRDNRGHAIWNSSQGNWVVGNTSNLGLDDGAFKAYDEAEVAENIISPLRPTQRARKMPWGPFMSQSN